MATLVVGAVMEVVVGAVMEVVVGAVMEVVVGAAVCTTSCIEAPGPDELTREGTRG